MRMRPAGGPATYFATHTRETVLAPLKVYLRRADVPPGADTELARDLLELRSKA